MIMKIFTKIKIIRHKNNTIHTKLESKKNLQKGGETLQLTFSKIQVN